LYGNFIVSQLIASRRARSYAKKSAMMPNIVNVFPAPVGARLERDKQIYLLLSLFSDSKLHLFVCKVPGEREKMEAYF
jgi:hypothetical protein